MYEFRHSEGRGASDQGTEANRQVDDPARMPDIRLRSSLALWALRVVLSVVTSAAVSATALVCAWREHRRFFTDRQNPAAKFPTIWEFVTNPEAGGIVDTCLLAGAAAFPIFLWSSWGLRRERWTWIVVFAIIGLTSAFAVGTAVVIGSLHIPSGH
jgi:hypothetical protein